MSWNFDNSYARDLPDFSVPWQLDPPPAPELLLFNRNLAEELGVPAAENTQPSLQDVFAGAALPPGAEPIALAYAGHQFGHFSQQLGDGRALLLGELITPEGGRFDLQLKGSGRTPFSRSGDGRSALGPALREYLVSEAMAAMGVKTTRALAVAKTGETVIREQSHPGAVTTRIAASHIRVGTFQFFAAHFGVGHVRQLTDYVIARHYPALEDSENRFLALLEAVMDAQIDLVASWVGLGFVHGVMNTDNVAISGETLDYGPCAFLDVYSASAKFSSIDRNGRYAFGNQPNICQWNMAQFASAMAANIQAVNEGDLEKAEQLLASFPQRYEAAWLKIMRRKLGMIDARGGDAELINRLFAAMEGQQVDHTGLFRRLMEVPDAGPNRAADLFADPAVIRPWIDDWLARIGGKSSFAGNSLAPMAGANPVYVPRNHKVEEALAAAEQGDMAPFKLLLDAVTNPFDAREEWAEFAGRAPDSFGPYVTFCGT